MIIIGLSPGDNKYDVFVVNLRPEDEFSKKSMFFFLILEKKFFILFIFLIDDVFLGRAHSTIGHTPFLNSTCRMKKSYCVCMCVCVAF